MEGKSSDFGWDASKIVTGSISADKILPIPVWEVYPYPPEAVKEFQTKLKVAADGIMGPRTMRAFIDQMNYHNATAAAYLDREMRPPPDTSWITTENLGERRSERRRKKPRNHPDNLQ